MIQYTVKPRGGSRGGGTPGVRPPLNWKKYDFLVLKRDFSKENPKQFPVSLHNWKKIWFFGVKSWFFTRNTPTIFAPPSAQRNFFKCAPLTSAWNPGSAPETCQCHVVTCIKRSLFSCPVIENVTTSTCSWEICEFLCSLDTMKCPLHVLAGYQVRYILLIKIIMLLLPGDKDRYICILLLNFIILPI
jgi:hypothetical protein